MLCNYISLHGNLMLLHAAENVTLDICNESYSTAGINGKINLSLNKENELFGLSSSEKNKILPIRHFINFKERSAFCSGY